MSQSRIKKTAPAPAKKGDSGNPGQHNSLLSSPMHIYQWTHPAQKVLRTMVFYVQPSNTFFQCSITQFFHFLSNKNHYSLTGQWRFGWLGGGGAAWCYYVYNIQQPVVGIQDDQKRYFSHNYRVSAPHLPPPCTVYTLVYQKKLFIERKHTIAYFIFIAKNAVVQYIQYYPVIQ